MTTDAAPWIAPHLVLGTMYFGTQTDERTSWALMDRYVEAGGTVLDTANCYAFWADPSGAGGQSESTVGAWLRANPGVRERLTIATKVGQEPARAGDLTEWEGLAPDVITTQCERSRERLGVDVIDLYWAHGEDRSTPLVDVVATMGALVEQGVEPWTALQLTTSYVRPRPDVQVPGKDHRFGFVTDETIDYLETHPELECWVYSPLVRGSYDRQDRPFPEAYRHPGTTARLATLREVTDELDVRPGQVVLSWLVQSTPSLRPIVGVSSLEQLDAALAAPQLGEDHLERLDVAR